MRKLLDQVGTLQRKRDNRGSTNPQARVTARACRHRAARPGDPADPGAVPLSQRKSPKWNATEDGIIIWKTPDEDKVPFLLKFNIVTQFRYLNTLDSDTAYTDHLGVVREVHTRKTSP